jgi:DNA-binding transcriptional ArsR family regulator
VPEVVRLADPATMRALAHPIRLDLLWHLLEVDTATSTECSAALGQSQATCSYHLRQLANAGFLAAVTSGDGRESRWRLVVRSFDLVTDTNEQRVAASAVEDELLLRDAEIVRVFREERDSYPKRWQRVTISRRSTIHLTAVELARLGAAFAEVLQPYVEREERGERVKGAERVHISLLGVPWRTRRPSR